MRKHSNPYRAAGTFSGASYTERQADRDLFTAIEENRRYPYILAPRQSGKSSLLNHIRTKLRPPHFRTAFIDFSIFDSAEIMDLDRFQSRFFDDWRRSLNTSLRVSERFIDTVESLLDRFPNARLVTFLDEIDALLLSPFKDTFFSIVRNVFNERAARPEMSRIQFILSGAARPEELISDRLRSPFNVGESIALNEFSLEETTSICSPLAELTMTQRRKLADLIFSYTGGSVYLTQLILEKCWNRVADSPARITFERLQTEIDKIVAEIISSADQDIHFQNIKSSFQTRKQALQVYQKLLAGEVVHKPSEREVLWFTGLSPREGTSLYRNYIYERVFKAGGSLDLAAELRPISHNLPSLQPFFGREQELQKIAEALDPESRTWGVLIDGPGGMGKTSLAVRAAYEAPADGFEKIVFVSLKSRELDDGGVRDLSGFLISGLAELLNELAKELGHADVAKAVENERPRMLLDALRGTKTLLVLDNLDSLLKSERDTVFTFVKKLPAGCKAILTSRGRIGSGAEELILERISEEAALATLAKLAETNPALAKTTEAERLTLYRETGGKPLLLGWTAGQIGRGSCVTFTDAIAYLRSCPEGNDPLEFIFGDLVEDFSEAETRTLCALTYFTLPAKVEHITTVAGREEAETERALKSLINRSLVVPSDELRTFTLVPLVGDFLRVKKPEVLRETGNRLETCAYALAEENGYDEYDRFPLLDADWPTVSAALPGFLAGENGRLQTVCNALRFFLEFTGRWDEWLSLERDAEVRAVAAKDFRQAGWRAYFVGWVHYLRRQSSEVLACAERAAAHWREGQGGDRERATAIRLRGVGHELAKDYPAAISAYRQAVELHRTMGVYNPDIATGLSYLADAEAASGDFDAAEREYREALQIVRSLGHHEAIATFTGNLAGLTLDRGDWRGAETLAHEALSLSEKVGRLELIGRDSHRLAKVLVRLGKKKEALLYAQRATEVYQELRHPQLAEAKQTLAKCESSESGPN